MAKLFLDEISDFAKVLCQNLLFHKRDLLSFFTLAIKQDPTLILKQEITLFPELAPEIFTAMQTFSGINLVLGKFLIDHITEEGLHFIDYLPILIPNLQSFELRKVKLGAVLKHFNQTRPLETFYDVIDYVIELEGVAVTEHCGVQLALCIV